MNAESFLTKMEKANKLFLADYENIKAKYPSQYVAVGINGNVVANNKNSDKLFTDLKRKKIDPAKVLIEYVLPKGKYMIL